MAATLVGFTGTAFAQHVLEPELIPASAWQTATTLRAGHGYKDNVFLSSTHPEAAAFAAAEAEFIALRIASVGPQITIFSSADAHHYFTSGSGHNEYTAFAQAQLEQDLSANSKLSLNTFYFYQDQVLDVSTTEQVAQPLTVVGHTITVQPAWRWSLPAQTWLSFDPGATRQFYEEPLDDYWETGMKLTFGCAYNPKSELALSYEPSWRFYDSEQALDALGEPIPGTSRQRFLQGTRLRWRHSWDAQCVWRSTVAAAYHFADENGAGYFDFARWQFAMKLEYRPAPWRFAADIRLNYYDYPNQPANGGGSANRKRTDFAVAGRIERDLLKQLRAAAFGEFSQTLSNDQFEEYSVSTIGGLLEWEF